LATAARFSDPSGIAIDSNGTIYVADYSNARVRKFTVGGNVTTFAGNGGFGLPINRPATASRLATPDGLAVDSRNNVYFTDNTANAIVRVSATGGLSIAAGNFDGYSQPQDGIATSVSLRNPQNVSVDSGGNILIVD